MEVDLGVLTAVLASRMAAIVPEGFHVQAAEGTLWYSADQGRFPGQFGDYQIGQSGTFVRENAAQALSELQDYIDEATHSPWPGESTPPRAYSQVRDRMLDLWYGGPDINSELCSRVD